MTRSTPALIVVATLLLMTGCTTTATGPTITAPPAAAGFDYQLGGPYAAPEGVTVVVRDSTAEPADAGYDICYVNGFQTQAVDAERWSTEQPELLLRNSRNVPIDDDDWPDEYVFDTSTPLLRSAILAAVGPSIVACAEAGYDAVEIDNLDTYTRWPERLTIEGNIALAVAYADLAHRLGLAIGQKNAAEDSARLREEVGFDFAIAEQCAQHGECAAYTDVYGDLVYDIEYRASDLPSACEAVGSAILRDRGLVAAESEGYAYQAC